jgi:hypothetical protein
MSYKAPEGNVPSPIDKIQLTRAAMHSLNNVIEDAFRSQEDTMTAELGWPKRENFVEARIVVLAEKTGREICVWLDTAEIERGGEVINEVKKSHLWALFEGICFRTIEAGTLSTVAEPDSSN